MRKSILFLGVASILACGEGTAGKLEEWRRLRQEMEKQGLRVDHFASSPAELEREAANWRRQLQQAHDPARGKSMRSIGGAAAVTPRRAAAPRRGL